MINGSRVRIRPFQITDDKFILELVNSNGWLKYIGDRSIHTLDDAQKYLINLRLKYESLPLGLSCVVLNTSHLPIGMCGLVKRETLSAPDLGFALLPEYEGYGYAREMTQLLIESYFSNPAANKLYAISQINNQRSLQLLSALGFKSLNQSYDGNENINIYQLINYHT